MNVTIKDIAKLAGVSINTVSRAINNKDDVNIKTKEKIMRIVKEMGYTPNLLAQGLKSKKSMLIGVIVTNITNPFYGEIIGVIEKIARKNDYNLMVFNTAEDKRNELEALTILKSRHVDGILITPVVADTDIMQFLKDIGMPFVIMNREPPPMEQVDYVVNDNIKGAYLAVSHLYERGIRTIHHITGPDTYTTEKRIVGCMKAAEDLDSSHALNIEFHHIPLTMQDCYQKTREILAGRKTERIGIFAYNDNLAIGAMKAIQEFGLKIPEDIALVGYDDIRFSSMLWVPLTTIHQSGSMIGEESVNCLLDIIDKKKERNRKSIILQPHLVIREST